MAGDEPLPSPGDRPLNQPHNLNDGQSVLSHFLSAAPYWCSLFATQYVTIVKFSVLPPSASYIQLERFAEAVQDQIQFNASDYALFVLLFTAVVSVLYREIRAGDLTWYLQQTLSNNRKAVSLLLGCALVCVRYYFAPGELSWAGDASHHIVTAQLAATTIRDGELPVWTFYMGNGSPYLQNYGFVFFYLVGFVDLVFGECRMGDEHQYEAECRGAQ